MVRTRAADVLPPPDASPQRRNPGRASRASDILPVRPSTRPFSYSELTSDDDSGSSVAGSEDFADDDEEHAASDAGSASAIGHTGSSRQAARRTSARISRRPQIQRESSRQATAAAPVAPNRPTRSKAKPKKQSNSGRADKQYRTAKSTARPPKKRQIEAPTRSEEIFFTGNVPNWTDPQIPYGAWADIFYYAAVAGGSDSIDVNWLLGVATTCKAFSEAALTAIYRSPPINTPNKARRLAVLLEQSPAETRCNYRAKIESLCIDIQVVPQTLLSKIVCTLPRLRELVLFTQYDQPPYRELDRTVRWHYTEDIFQALGPISGRQDGFSAVEKPYHTHLKSWEWSGRLLGGHVATIADITRIHQEPSFAYLSKISFTNFQVPSLHKPRPKPGDEERELQLYNEDGEVISLIADAISKLPALRHLIFESSTVMNDRLLPLLPKSLVHLGLINCWEVKSEDLARFLQSHGAHIRSLVLSHNQSLDLAFLTSLSNTCPVLEELHMNMSYFRHHDSLSLVNNDADPMYDQALLPHQVLQWPSAIRMIDLEHVRHWSVETAEMFLQSLIDSASNLPNLRHLAIKTMLDIPWKSRATMRHEWRTKLDKVFLRPFHPPLPHVSLQSQQQEVQQTESGDAVSPSAKKKRKVAAEEPSRRSTRIAAQPSDSDSRQSSNSKGLRSQRDRPLYKDPDTDESEFDSDPEEEADVPPGQSAPESGTKGGEMPKPLFIQGLCSTVSIVFDNQKPTELQYGMEDFMDDDRTESDEEWNGDSEEDDAVFVWR